MGTRYRLLGLLTVSALAVTAAACGSNGDAGNQPSGGPLSPSGGGASTSVSRLWVTTWTPSGEGPPASAASIAVGSVGDTVWVDGDGPLVAYDAMTGEQRWLAADQGGDSQGLVAVGPDGAQVYATGTTGGEGPLSDYVTTAYDARTGEQLWRTTYDGPAHRADTPAAVVAVDGLVVVTGTSAGAGTGADLATVAYDATTGQQRWVSRYDGPGHRDELWFGGAPHALAADPAGSHVYVVAGSAADARRIDFVTLAYDSTTGRQRWVARHGGADPGQALASAVAVSPDGATVVTSGMSAARRTRTDIVTIGYDAVTGAERWASRYDGPAHRNEGPAAVTFGPANDAVYVAGTSEGATPGHEDFVTLAYQRHTGAQLWVDRFDGSNARDENAADLAVSPDGATVLVTGRSVPAPMEDTYATVAYAATDGRRQWVTTYGVPGGGIDGARSSEAHAVVADPAGHTVFVTGVSGRGYATVAYRY